MANSYKGFYYTSTDEIFISTAGFKRIKVGAAGEIFISGLTQSIDPLVVTIDETGQLHTISATTFQGSSGTSGTDGTSGTMVHLVQVVLLVQAVLQGPQVRQELVVLMVHQEQMVQVEPTGLLVQMVHQVQVVQMAQVVHLVQAVLQVLQELVVHQVAQEHQDKMGYQEDKTSSSTNQFLKM